MRLFRRQVNKGLRHRAKELINSCQDFDNLIIPVPDDIVTMWDSPRDGRGPWFWERRDWWTEERELEYYQMYLKGFRK